MPLHFVLSQKGVKQLKYKGYLYTHERQHHEKKYWKCVEFTSHKCLGRVHTKDDEVVKEVNNHNHEKRNIEIAAKEFIAEIKHQANTNTQFPSQILATTSATLSPAVASKLPNVDYLKRTIQRQRQVKGNGTPTPKSLIELTITSELVKTLKGEDFLLFDSGPQDNRIILFGTQKNLNLLAASPHWYADGTFKTAPPLFAQLFTIHGIQYNNVVPAIYALMPNRTTETYGRVLEAIKFSRPTISPISILTDFEMAQMNAFRSAFPNIETRGCFFHFCQAVYRNIRSNKAVLELYEDENNLENALQIRQLASLAFVPVADVITSFNMLLDTDFYRQHDAVLMPLIEYFEDNWIGRAVGNGTTRRTARYPLSTWNCYDTVVDNLPKTNNSVEGWHRAFSSLISCHHPSFWKFVEGLKKDQSLNELKIEQYLAGTPPPQSYRRLLEAIRFKDVVKEYGQRNTIDYLRGVAHNLSFPSE